MTTATAGGYTVTLDGDWIEITDAEGHAVGDGNWVGGRIVNCAATIGEDTFEALEDALGDAEDDAEREANLARTPAADYCPTHDTERSECLCGR